MGSRRSTVGGVEHGYHQQMSFADVYAGRKTFVTGHTGFKGSWLSEWLLSLGAEVTGYALEPPTDPNLFDAIGLGSRVRHVLADVRDVDQLTVELRAARPEIVFHLAARAIVRQAYAAPRDTFETNIMGTVNVLEAVRACTSVRAVVVVTSDKCYENTEFDHAYRETDAMGGRDPYSASKGAAELVTRAYRDSYFTEDVAVASARAGNVIGGGDWGVDRIVPDCVRALTAGVPIVVRNPDAVRPWQHVLEPLSGYLQLGARLLGGDRSAASAWNFGPDTAGGERSVRWVVERFLDAWGGGTWTLPAGASPEPHEAHRLSLDSTKARERLGWTPVWDAEEAIRHTATWYRTYADAPDEAGRLVREQLTAYRVDALAASQALAAAPEVEVTR